MKSVLLLSLLSASLGLAETISITQKASGITLSVDVKNVTDQAVTFESRGNSYTLSLSDLTAESVQELKSLNLSEESEEGQKTPASAEDQDLMKTLNEAIGHELFSAAGSLWNEKAEGISKRLKWKKESLKASNSSYRLYPKTGYSLLGARPYCLTLYGGKDDAPERVSMVFANKGDFGSTAGMGEDHFGSNGKPVKPPKDLEEAIERDTETIAQALTEALGEPEKQYYGEKEDLRKVQRWDFMDHSFLLSAKDGEYVHLLIVGTEDADAKGKIKFIKDSDLRDLHAENVLTEENGDVRIDNIPMVNQGPKGYCAPATFERAMRYMQVPADMYLLATSATNIGGGTNTAKLAEDSKRIVRSKARRIRDLSLEEDLNIKLVKKYVDKGVPILWQMCSLHPYNDLANERTKARSKVEDYEKYAIEIAEEAEKMVDKLSLKDRHHICMIVGYNETTNELAVSDSWGASYELRWVHLDICKAVTSRGGFVIDF